MKTYSVTVRSSLTTSLLIDVQNLFVNKSVNGRKSEQQKVCGENVRSDTSHCLTCFDDHALEQAFPHLSDALSQPH